MASDIDSIVARLHDVAEELADLSIERIRNAIDNGGDALPVDDKVISRARRAVLKAANLLESGSNGSSATDW